MADNSDRLANSEVGKRHNLTGVRVVPGVRVDSNSGLCLSLSNVHSIVLEASHRLVAVR